MLDPVEFEQARVSRNRAYDGRFFTGVRTTGVYCRPVCPVRACTRMQCRVLSFGRGCRGGRLSTLPQMPTRNSAVLSGMERVTNDSRPDNPADP